MEKQESNEKWKQTIVYFDELKRDLRYYLKPLNHLGQDASLLRII